MLGKITLTLLLILHTPIAMSQEPTIEDDVDFVQLKYAELSVSYSNFDDYRRVYDNIYDLLTQPRLNRGDALQASLTFRKNNLKLCQSEIQSHRQLLDIVVKGTTAARDAFKLIPETEAGFNEAAKLYWERIQDDDIPRFRRVEACWILFKCFGPEYFFTDCFIGKEFNLSEDQIVKIRRSRKKALGVVSGISAQVEEIAYAKLLDSLTDEQVRRIERLVGRKNLIRALCAKRNNMSRFRVNLRFPHELPFDWRQIAKNTDRGIFPACLLETNLRLNSPSNLNVIDTIISGNYGSTLIFSYGGAPLAMQTDGVLQFDEDLLKQLTETLKIEDIAQRRRKYDEAYRNLRRRHAPTDASRNTTTRASWISDGAIGPRVAESR